MGVGADHGLAGGGQALLGQEGVLYPHAAHIVEMGDVKRLANSRTWAQSWAALMSLQGV